MQEAVAFPPPEKYTGDDKIRDRTVAFTKIKWNIP
jgi:hypothetical protein